MAKLFNLTVLTPERVFFNGEVEMLSLRTVDGDYAIMADHSPIVMPVVVGSLTIWKPDGMETAFNSEGFMEVDHTGTTVYIQACEKPEEIDSRRHIYLIKLVIRRARESGSFSHTLSLFKGNEVCRRTGAFVETAANYNVGASGGTIFCRAQKMAEKARPTGAPRGVTPASYRAPPPAAPP